MNDSDNIVHPRFHPPPIPLSRQVEQAVELYFSQLQDHTISNLYTLVMNEVEKPLLAAVLKHSGYNQTKASKVLGISRSTLRKKIDFHHLS
jgi:Fis family transcriptional regulator